jgi:hypothetical protein
MLRAHSQAPLLYLGIAISLPHGTPLHPMTHRAREASLLIFEGISYFHPFFFFSSASLRANGSPSTNSELLRGSHRPVLPAWSTLDSE